jgi:predicted deacylase
VLVYLGVVNGTPQRITSSVVIRETGYCRDDVWSEKGGIVEYTVKMGDRVKKGSTLAKIRNVFGEVVQEVKMPEDGYMVSGSSANATQTGGWIGTIAVKKK